MPSRKLITKKVEFSASHRCWNRNWTAEKNLEVFGKSSLPGGHGHNFALEVTVEGEIDPETGMIINLFDLKEIIGSVLVDFDHKNLNEDNPRFRDLVPTIENMSKVLWERVEEELRGREDCRLHRIRVYETEDLFCDYWKCV